MVQDLENVGPTFSSLTVLLGGKSLKTIDYGLFSESIFRLFFFFDQRVHLIILMVERSF